MTSDLEEMGKDATVEPLEDLSQLSQEATSEIFQWWLSNRDSEGQALVPYWNKFDIIEFAPFSNRISVSERLAGGNFKFRIQGEHVLEILGRDRLRELDIRQNHEQAFERDLFSYYSSICEEAVPYVFKGALPTIDKGHVQIECVDLPFKDENGDVNKILSLLQDFK